MTFPSVALSPASAAEGSWAIHFPIALEHPERAEVWVKITTGRDNEPNDPPIQWGPSASEDDFFHLVSSGAWAPGDLVWDLNGGNATVSVLLHDDPHDEPNETFDLEVSGRVWNESFTDAELFVCPIVTGTIVDDDDPLEVSIGGLSVNEDAGVALIPVTVHVPPGWGENENEWQDQTGQSWFYVVYEIHDESTTADEDYDAGSGIGMLMLTPEQPSGFIEIEILDDSFAETAERFFVTLLPESYAISERGYGFSSNDSMGPGGWSNFAFVNSAAIISINDNDSPPDTGTGDTGTGGTDTGGTDTGGTDTGGTGTGGTGTGGTGTGGTGTGGTDTGGTDTGGTDTGGTDTGGTSTGGTGTGGTDAGGTGTGGTDAGGTGTGGTGMPPSVMIGDASANEDAGTIEFLITVANPGADAITVNYSTSDNTATSPADYSSASGSITIPAGATSATLSVAVTDDTDAEFPESFSISISLPSGSTAQIAVGSAMGQISDNDGSGGGGGGAPLPSITIYDTSVNEDAGFVTVSVGLTQASPSSVSVTVSTADGSATDGTDYDGQSFTLTIPANMTSFSFTIPIIDDTQPESDETFDVVLSNPSGASLADDGTGTVTILDNEPVVSVGTPGSGGEGTGNGNNNAVAFWIGVSPAFFSTTITVNYTVTFEPGDTADQSDLGSPITGSVTFQPNDAPTQLVNIPVIDDNLVEAAEQFTFTLTSATGATVSPTGTSVIGTINDNDPVTSNGMADIDGPESFDESSESFWIAVVDDSPELPEDIPEEYFDPAEFSVTEDLVPLTLAATGQTGFTVEIVVSDPTVVKLWETQERLVEITSGTEYVLGDAPGLPACIYVEAIAEGDSDIELIVRDPANPLVLVANDKVTAKAGQSRLHQAVTRQTAELDFTALWSSNKTDAEKAQEIETGILNAFNAATFGNYDIVDGDAADGDLPDIGIAFSPRMTTANVTQIRQDGNYAMSGWVLGWKLVAAPYRDRFYDFSGTRIRFMAWHAILEVPATTADAYTRIKVVNNVIVDDVQGGLNNQMTPRDRLLAHERMHADGIKEGANLLGRTGTSVTWVRPGEWGDPDLAPANQAAIRIGYKAAFDITNKKFNQKVKELKSTTDVTSTAALEVLRSAIREGLIGSEKRAWYSAAGEWHTDIQVINGIKTWLYDFNDY